MLMKVQLAAKHEERGAGGTFRLMDGWRRRTRIEKMDLCSRGTFYVTSCLVLLVWVCIPVLLAVPAQPAGPIGPTGPCGPVAPVGPVSPCGPIGPSAPAGPSGPT